MAGTCRELDLIARDRNSKASSSGRVVVKSWSKPERAFRAVMFGGASLVLSGVSVIIPVAHFILVPLFLIAAPVMGIYVYRVRSAIISGKYECPICGSEISISKMRFSSSFLYSCQNCMNFCAVDIIEPELVND